MLIKRIAVIDSSPLINLTHLMLAQKLSLFFTVIYVPTAVQREVNKKSRFRHRLNKLYATGLFMRCKGADAVRIKLLQELHEGEAEALAQAQDKSAGYFVADEKHARTIGQNMGLQPIGTVRLLARMHIERYAPETRSLVQKLRRDLQFRVSDDVIEHAIREASEPI